MRPVVQIEARLPQTMYVEVVGKDVAWLDGNREQKYEGAEDAVPDIVERFARAARVGLLGSSFARPDMCGAVVQSRVCDEKEQRQQWIVSVDRVDWGAFRILHNLLAARNFDGVLLRTIPADTGARSKELDMASLAYPTFSDEKLPFAVSRAELVRAKRDRAVRVTFSGLPADPIIDAAIEVLDLWAELVVWGGYAPPGMDPRRSGGLPDGAILYDERTIAQGFSQAFVSDEAAFEAVLGYAVSLSWLGAPVAEVAIQ